MQTSLAAAGMSAALMLGIILAIPGGGDAGGGLGTDPPADDRIVTLAPSVTEIVWALGAGDRVVGVCGQCDHPAAAGTLPRVGGYLAPSVEVVAAMRPGLVIAVPSPGNREVVRALEGLGIEVLVVRDRVLDDLWRSTRTIAGRLGRPGAGEHLVAAIRRELDAVRAAVAGRAPRRTLLVVGHRPLVVAGSGTLQDELLAIAGGLNVARKAGAAWPMVSMEFVTAQAPEVIIDAAMGTEQGGRSVFEHVGADAGPPVVRLDMDALLRTGPRVGQAAWELAHRLHPDLER